MRRLVAGFLALFTVGALLMLVSHSWSQPPNGLGPPNALGRPQPPRGRGGPLPTPPVLEAIDTNRDGEISAAELKNAAAALRSLDKDNDGELAGPELFPAGMVGPGGPGGGPGAGPGGFGGRGPGNGGRGGFNPFGGGGNSRRLAPEEVEFKDGIAAIPDQATYRRLSYKGEQVMIDTFLAGLEFVKFTLDGADTDEPKLYFINTNTHRAHMMFGNAVGLPRARSESQMKGVLVYRPMLKSPSGTPGLFTFEFEPFDSYGAEMVARARDHLVAKMPRLKGNIGYFPRGDRANAKVESEKAAFEKAGIKVYRDADLVNTDVAYLPLNPGTSFGRLRVMGIDERPGPRDVVLYETLPNEMPRVAGIITAVRQTPLSHVNLRAVQDKVPNAFVLDAANDPAIKPLIGKQVAYRVTADGFEIREASQAEVTAHFAAIRPARPQVPKRGLDVTEIRSLDDVKFEDSSNFGVKAANVATLRTVGLPEGTVPDGHAVPFYFYDQFMKSNGFYDYARQLIRNPEFKKRRDVQEEQLKKFRALIKKGKMPESLMTALDKTHQTYEAGTSLRCRSSTNNEDLPGFSGAGLYDSYTHRPDEGHLAETIKQVFAGMWNYRAFEEREFYRVDHFSAAMGVLIHTNYKGELANGVAVTDDILYQTEGNYYVNTQVGEDLVTNPEAASVPEEVLLDWWKSTDVQVMRSSNRSTGNKPLLSAKHLEQLRSHLGAIHAEFAKRYGKSLDAERFAVEIEFKITKDDRLVIKQARPWVYAPSAATENN